MGNMDQGRPQFPPEEPRGDPRRDPRGGMGRGPPMGGSANGAPPMRPPPSNVVPQPGAGGNMQLPPHLAGADPEKAQLIMQVLQLTDEQIAVLPSEQRQSIMVLKEQIKQHGPMR